jgi:hypothetical protein
MEPRVPAEKPSKLRLNATGGWENTEILNKCYGGVPEHIKAQIARSIHVRFDTLSFNCPIAVSNHSKLV